MTLNRFSHLLFVLFVLRSELKMRTAFVISAFTCWSIVFCIILQAQEDALSLVFKESTIGQLSARINDYYVEPELALTVSEHLKKRHAEGHFDDV